MVPPSPPTQVNSLTLIPEAELDGFLHLITLALSLGDEGRVTDGFLCLAAGLEYARRFDADWALVLELRFSRALSHYTREFGAVLLAVQEAP